MVPGLLETRAIFLLVLLSEPLKMELMMDDLPQLDRPTNSSYFSL